MTLPFSFKLRCLGISLCSIGLLNTVSCKQRNTQNKAAQKNLTAVKNGAVYALAPLGTGVVLRKCLDFKPVVKLEDFSVKCPEVIAANGSSNQRIFLTEAEFRAAWDKAFELDIVTGQMSKDEALKPIAGKKNSEIIENEEVVASLNRGIADLDSFVKNVDPSDEEAKILIADLNAKLAEGKATQTVIDIYVQRVNAAFAGIMSNKEVVLAKFNSVNDSVVVSILEAIYNTSEAPKNFAPNLSTPAICVPNNSEPGKPTFDIQERDKDANGKSKLITTFFGADMPLVTWKKDLCEASILNSRNNIYCLMDFERKKFYLSAMHKDAPGGFWMRFSMNDDPYECLKMTAFSTAKALCARDGEDGKYLHAIINTFSQNNLFKALNGERFETFDACIAKINQIK